MTDPVFVFEAPRHTASTRARQPQRRVQRSPTSGAKRATWRPISDNCSCTAGSLHTPSPPTLVDRPLIAAANAVGQPRHAWTSARTHALGHAFVCPTCPVVLSPARLSGHYERLADGASRTQ